MVVVVAGEGPVLVVGVQCVEEPAQLSSAQLNPAVVRCWCAHPNSLPSAAEEVVRQMDQMGERVQLYFSWKRGASADKSSPSTEAHVLQQKYLQNKSPTAPSKIPSAGAP